MQAHQPTWWYTSLDSAGRRVTAVQVLGQVTLPSGSGWLVQVVNKTLFNSTKLLLFPSGQEREPGRGLVPVRAYDGSRLVAGAALDGGYLSAAEVLDIGGVAGTRKAAEAWSSR